jgi:hypothetical protein
VDKQDNIDMAGIGVHQEKLSERKKMLFDTGMGGKVCSRNNG